MKVALLQSPAIMGNVCKNYAIAANLVKRANKLGAEFFVFPEMSLTGYFDKKGQMENSISTENEFIKKMIDLTANRKTIIFGLSEKRDNGHYITQVVAHNGKLIGKYEKHNLAGNEKKNYKVGKELPMFCINGLNFGITICADIDLGALYKNYKQKGCEIVFECASPDLYGESKNRDWEKGYEWWRGNCIKKIGKYSKDNKLKIAVVTMSGRNEYGDFPGGGYLFSHKGTLVAETKNHQDEILIIDLTSTF
jgi:NAD+ synthase (glutamine-hydrolysing)